MITFSQAIAYLKSDEPVQKTAVITIDDAYKSFLKNGLPLLKKYNFPSTLFINTETVGGGVYMDWAQLQSAHHANAPFRRTRTKRRRQTISCPAAAKAEPDRNEYPTGGPDALSVPAGTGWRHQVPPTRTG